MNHNYSVSVVIPSFNRPLLTLRAVKSVLDQTWTNFEIVVIDDGSRSDQIFPIELIKDARVRLIRHPTNLGVSAARNTGVRESRHSLVAFLDSDDCWLPEKLANQIAAYDKHGSKQNAFIYSSYYHEQGNMRTICPLNSWKRDQPLSDFIFLSRGNIHTSTWLTSRTLLQQFPFDLNLSQCEDYDLLLRLEAAGVEFVWCKIPAAVHNCDLREDRLSTRLSKDSYLKFLEYNSKRLTPFSYVVLESTVLNATNGGSSASRLQNHLRHFLKSPRLNYLSRIGLVLTYLVHRGTLKARLLCKTRGGDNPPEVPSVGAKTEERIRNTPSRTICRSMTTPMNSVKTAIIIATKDRPEILMETLQSIRRQTRPAAHAYVSVSSLKDAPSGHSAEEVIVLVGPPGGSAQRNTAIRQVSLDVEYIAFFDDDIELHPSYLEHAVNFLEKYPDVVAISGIMIADGNISREAARALLDQDTTWMSDPSLRDHGPHHILYACNAVIRARPLRETMFDENLPLYSYGEDYDLSLRLKRFGRVGRLSNAVGVHLQTQTARVSGKRYGYAVVANNWYFIQKGVSHIAAPWSYVRFVVIVLKRLYMNFKSALSGQVQRDPWGQLQGNLLALIDIIFGRSSPNRILDL
jgi:glycosyltransferase involved in cell wall biosynthesis